MTMNFKKGE